MRFGAVCCNLAGDHCDCPPGRGSPSMGSAPRIALNGVSSTRATWFRRKNHCRPRSTRKRGKNIKWKADLGSNTYGSPVVVVSGVVIVGADQHPAKISSPRQDQPARSQSQFGPPQGFIAQVTRELSSHRNQDCYRQQNCEELPQQVSSNAHRFVFYRMLVSRHSLRRHGQSACSRVAQVAVCLLGSRVEDRLYYKAKTVSVGQPGQN